MPNNSKKKKQESTLAQSLPTIAKGSIAIMLTILMVVIIVMLFAKSLFINNSSDRPTKTGRLTTAAAAVSREETETKETKETKEKTTTKKKSDDPYQTDANGNALGDSTTMTVIGAVYLHPEPTSSSENLLVIPQGATVNVYSSDSTGWLYLEYDGQYGYAYGTFFQ